MASGRAASGRSGINLASTVSRVMEVPATQSSGVVVRWPASTVAISSSVASKMVAPLASSRASFGWRMTPGIRSVPRMANDQGDGDRDTLDGFQVRGVDRSTLAMPTPIADVDEREEHERLRRADERDEQERDDEAARDGAERVDAKERAGAPPDPGASGGRSMDAAGSVRPMTIVVIRTTGRAAPMRAIDSLEWLTRVGTAWGREMNPTRPSTTSAGREQCEVDRRRIGSRIRGRMRTRRCSAPIARPDRNSTRMTVNTYVVLPVPEASSRVHRT